MVYHRIAGDWISGVLSYRSTGALPVTTRIVGDRVTGFGYGVVIDGNSGLLSVEVPGHG